MKFVSAIQFLLCFSAFGFDALRRGEEPFRGTLKPYVPGFYILRLDGKKEILFDNELFCKEIRLPGKVPHTIQWVLTERNFSRLARKYWNTVPFEERFVQDKGFGLPATTARRTGKQMTILHFEPDFEERHSFAFRITATHGGTFYLNGRFLAEIPAKAPCLIRIPWWEMRSLPSRVVLVRKTGTRSLKRVVCMESVFWNTSRRIRQIRTGPEQCCPAENGSWKSPCPIRTKDFTGDAAFSRPE